MRRSPFATLLLAALVLPACLPRSAHPSSPSLTSVADALLAGVEGEGALSGAIVLDAATGFPLYARHEHVRLLPASTMKVVSTSAALSALGPDFRFHTPVWLQGSVAGNLFLGELVVEASGDPSLGSWRFPETAQACEQLADALVARGIRQWFGPLRITHADEGPYGGLYGPGWAWDDAAYAFGAAPTRFAFRENVAELSVKRAEGQDCAAPVPQPLEVRYSPPLDTSTTAIFLDPAASRAGLGCTRERGTGRTRCVWRSTPGQCPARASTRVSVEAPEALFTACLEDALTARGVWRVATPFLPPMATPTPSSPRELLLDFVSPPLSELVKVTNKESLNLYAERLGLRFTLERMGTESYTALREAFTQELHRRGIAPRLLRPVDGSGLSRYNVASARGLAEVLATSLREPYANALLESLPVAGVDGTLAGSAGAAIKGLVRAKTGTLSGQKAYVGIAERPHDTEHPRVVFALMLGNMDEQPALTTAQIFERFAEALVAAPLK